MDTKEIFAGKLLELRESRGISRQEMADDLGITRASLEYYEKAKRTPDINLISKISDYFNVSIDYLFGLSDVQSNDEDVQFICEYTGLEEDAVDVLHTYKKFGLETVISTLNWLLKTEMSTICFEMGLLTKSLEEYKKLEILTEIGNYLQYLPNDNEKGNYLNITESGKMLNDNELFNATNIDDMFTIACVRKDEIINKVLLDNIVSSLKSLKRCISQQGGEQDADNSEA